jgi:hypothetical protein
LSKPQKPEFVLMLTYVSLSLPVKVMKKKKFSEFPGNCDAAATRLDRRLKHVAKRQQAPATTTRHSKPPKNVSQSNLGQLD